MGKKAADRIPCTIKIVLYGHRRPEVITNRVFLEDAQAFEKALAEHRRLRKRHRVRDYKQTFDFVDTNGAVASFPFDAVYTFEILDEDSPKPEE